MLLLATGCSGEDPASPQRTMTVFAAASLSQVFRAEGVAFEKSRPGVHVEFSFAGSQTLAAQVRQGAPASVLATADVATIQSVNDELAGEPVVFAHNQLAIVTAAGNPHHVTSLADLARPVLKVVLAGPTVPIGKASRIALRNAGVTVNPVSLEDSVFGALVKVATGEADATIGYVTDIVRKPSIDGTPIEGTSTDLAIARTRSGSAPDDAEAFIAFVRSRQGQGILREFGFT